MDKTIEFEKAIENGNYKQINIFIEESIKHFERLIKQSALEDLERELDLKRTLISFWAEKELVDENPHFILGRYAGYLDLLYEQLSSKVKEKAFIDGINCCSVSEIPHVNDIISTLYHEEGIRHGRLAEKVGIEKSTLTGIMDRLVARKVVKFSRPGKYKYYYLTDIGIKYFDDNRKNLEATTNLDALIEQLLLTLSKEESDINGKIVKVISSLFKGKNEYEGYQSNVSEKINPAFIFGKIPCIEPINVMMPDKSIRTVTSSLIFNPSKSNSIVSLLSNNDNNILKTSIPIAIAI